MHNKIQVYERVFHDIQMFANVTLDRPALNHLISIICDWSYAHRQGNGELSDEEQQELIDYQFKKLETGEYRDSVWNSGIYTRFKRLENGNNQRQNFTGNERTCR